MTFSLVEVDPGRGTPCVAIRSKRIFPMDEMGDDEFEEENSGQGYNITEQTSIYL